jgi:hypothetical protein
MGFWNIFLLYIVFFGLLISTVNCEMMEIENIQEQNRVNVSLNSSNVLKGNENLKEAPDYTITHIELPVSEGIISPGKSIHPIITIKNEGITDPNGTGMEIGGYLNDTPLTRISVKIEPPGAGEEKSYSLVYQLPDSMELKSYKLSLILDPEKRTMDINSTNNRGTAGGMVSITPPDDDSFIGCEACWKNYK